MADLEGNPFSDPEGINPFAVSPTSVGVETLALYLCEVVVARAVLGGRVIACIERVLVGQVRSSVSAKFCDTV